MRNRHDNNNASLLSNSFHMGSGGEEEGGDGGVSYKELDHPIFHKHHRQRSSHKTSYSSLASSSSLESSMDEMSKHSDMSGDGGLFYKFLHSFIENNC
mmetsp:Transcript_39586/g.51040  ORF Transcript_39586/g.51040 Transcript_39586/m.51040 type:complete len:98 (+) Transcript_39586:1-294(+)